MSSLVHSLMWQFAVISVRTGPRCERVIIAYCDEQSLRDLLAAPSILGLGYRSREEAQAHIDCFTTDSIYLAAKDDGNINHYHPIS